MSLSLCKRTPVCIGNSRYSVHESGVILGHIPELILAPCHVDQIAVFCHRSKNRNSSGFVIEVKNGKSISFNN